MTPGPPSRRDWVRIDVDMADHPKIEGLRPVAFQLFMRLIFESRRRGTDGRLGVETVHGLGTKRTRQMLAQNGLLLRDGDSYLIHDFLDYQESAEDAFLRSKERRTSGASGAHRRWHTLRGVVSPNCSWCPNRTNPTNDA